MSRMSPGNNASCETCPTDDIKPADNGDNASNTDIRLNVSESQTNNKRYNIQHGNNRTVDSSQRCSQQFVSRCQRTRLSSLDTSQQRCTASPNNRRCLNRMHDTTGETLHHDAAARIFVDFRCEFCGEMFVSHKKFVRHVEQHGQEKFNVRCRFCPKVFVESSLLDRHETTSHFDRTPYVCCLCDYRTGLSKNIRQHFTRKHIAKTRSKQLPGNPISLSSCQHIKTENDDESQSLNTPRRLQCEICRKSFDTKYKLTRHEKQVHINYRPFICQDCGRGFFDRYHMRIHLDKCCSKMTAASVNRRRRSLCSQTTYVCPQCTAIFATRVGLLKHSLSHSVKSTLSCSFCLKEFQLPAQLIRHERSHTDPEAFRCPVCNKGFAESGNMRHHIRNVHGRNESDRPHFNLHRNYEICLNCGQTFTCRAKFLRHSLIHTQKTTFSCEYCNKEFKSPQQLIRHERCHTNPEAFRCDVCNKGFADAGNWRRHMRDVHDRNRRNPGSHGGQRPKRAKFKSSGQGKFSNNCSNKNGSTESIAGDVDVVEHRCENESLTLANVPSSPPSDDDTIENMDHVSDEFVAEERDRETVSDELCENECSKNGCVSGAVTMVTDVTVPSSASCFNESQLTTAQNKSLLVSDVDNLFGESSDKADLHQAKVRGLKHRQYWRGLVRGQSSRSSSQRQVKCKICGQKLRTQTFRQHLESHRPLQCNRCKRTFMCKTNYARHLRYATCRKRKAVNDEIDNNSSIPESSNSDNQLTCATCGLHFRQTLKYLEHTQTHVDINRLQCQLCGKQFKFHSALLRHTRLSRCRPSVKSRSSDSTQFTAVKDVQSEPGVSCQYEPTSCDRKSRRYFRCDICLEVFFYYLTFLCHKQRHTGDTIFTCSHCQKSFDTAKQLVLHEKIHSSQRFVCIVCRHRFTQRDYLQKHMERKHTVKSRFACRLCGCQFSTAARLDRHAETRCSAKCRQCRLCLLKFRTQAALDYHMQHGVCDGIERPREYLSELLGVSSDDRRCENLTVVSQQDIDKTSNNRSVCVKTLSENSSILVDAGSADNVGVVKVTCENITTPQLQTEKPSVGSGSNTAKLTSGDCGSDSINHFHDILSPVVPVESVSVLSDRRGTSATSIGTEQMTGKHGLSTDTYNSVRNTQQPLTTGGKDLVERSAFSILTEIFTSVLLPLNSRQSAGSSTKVCDTVASTEQSSLQSSADQRRQETDISSVHCDISSSAADIKTVVTGSETSENTPTVKSAVHLLPVDTDDSSNKGSENCANDSWSPKDFDDVSYASTDHTSTDICNPDSSTSITDGTVTSEILNTPKSDDGIQDGKKIHKLKRRGSNRLSTEVVASSWLCSHCGALLLSASMLRTHLRTKHAEQTSENIGWYVCQYCSSSFTEFSVFDTHRKTCRLGQMNFMCQFCPKQFTALTSVQLHEQMHTGDAAFVCAECDARFIFSSALRKHLATMHSAAATTSTGPRVFSCPACHLSFERPTSLLFHSTMHTLETDFACIVCQKRFPSPAFVLRHERTTHSREMFHVCHVCRYRFKDSTGLAFHVQQQHLHSTATSQSSQSLNCRVCDEVVTGRQLYVKHMRKHKGLTDDAATFACKLCGEEFNDMFVAMRHELTHIDVDRFCCPDCGQCFYEKNNMRAHFSRVHGDRLGKYNCVECSKTFRWRAELLYHVTKQHETSANQLTDADRLEDGTQLTENSADLPEAGIPTLTGDGCTSFGTPIFRFMCVKCDEHFRHYGLLQEHVNKVHNNNNNNIVGIKHSRRVHNSMRVVYCCPGCKDTFNTPCLLISHSMLHTHDTHISCMFCSKTFTEVYTMWRHETTTHCDEMSNVCQLCGFRFAESSSLQHHELLIHRDRISNSDEQISFRCKYCDELVTGRTLFITHMRNHKGLTDGTTIGACKLCGEEFCDMFVAMRHELTHICVDMFYCPDCGLCFSSMDGMRRHFSRIHEDHLGEYSCAECSKTFRWRADLLHHVSKQHETSTGSIRLFRTAISTGPHASNQATGAAPSKDGAQTVEAGSKTPTLPADTDQETACFKCNKCGACFPKLVKLVKHSLRHTGDTNFKCKYCDVVFARPSHLLRHERRHSQYTCLICHKQTAHFGNLLQHFKFQHHKTADRTEYSFMFVKTT